ncbi:hypothetical protein PAXRUDRAFT_824762 [Paxillus rubicundulus Ve08.2h10]|uniref:Uncharacterized protein n=1 Tax=Paxillus rubicundulus Ve08.2h10 TaxID=930991 RepID=A0A0D0DU07_9AGAM|nr:hypothetical protein PAXRUDRAFT_824762 [Paxillus rubicundulus Ve08.2h10]
MSGHHSSLSPRLNITFFILPVLWVVEINHCPGFTHQEYDYERLGTKSAVPS